MQVFDLKNPSGGFYAPANILRNKTNSEGAASGSEISLQALELLWHLKLPELPETGFVAINFFFICYGRKCNMEGLIAANISKIRSK